MTRAGENAAKVCEFLRDHPKIERVGYLGFLKDDAQADIFRRHCTGAGSTFSLYVKGGEKESFAFLDALRIAKLAVSRSEEHTSELQSLMRISYAVFCLKKKKKYQEES